MDVEGPLGGIAVMEEADFQQLLTTSQEVQATGRRYGDPNLKMRGSWQQAEEEAERVCEDLAEMHVRAAAEGHYQVGELRRLRGDLSGAEAAYQRAREMGRDPQPGLALTSLARERVDGAAISIRSALAAEPHDRLARARLCAAAVEIALANGDLDWAHTACGELESTAAQFGSSGLEASALHARALIGFSEDNPEEALPVLRSACRSWKELGAPYEAACLGVLLAETYASLGDMDAFGSELDASAAAFERLGAAGRAERVRSLRGKSRLPDGLTEREVEVLALVAQGRTNREVATALFISEKTVARHLANIFTKVGASSRTAAAAYAFEQGIAGSVRP